MKRRAQFSQIVSSGTSLTVSRYFRLMALSMTEIVFNLPLSIYGLYFNATFEPIYPWQGWDNIHFEYFIVDTIPSIIWRSSPAAVVNLELSRWVLILCALLFFVFFGFAEEARKNYRSAYYWTAAKFFGVVPPWIGRKILLRCVFFYWVSHCCKLNNYLVRNILTTRLRLKWIHHCPSLFLDLLNSPRLSQTPSYRWATGRVVPRANIPQPLINRRYIPDTRSTFHHHHQYHHLIPHAIFLKSLYQNVHTHQSIRQIVGDQRPLL